MHTHDWVYAFEHRLVQPEAFRHADHVEAAWQFLQRFPLHEVLERYSAGIRAIAESVGKSDKYHETITWTLLFVIHDRIARAPATQTWEEFARENDDLFRWRELLARYYRPSTLELPVARSRYLFPDASLTEAAR